jgi:hypothetical protein
VGKVRVPIEWSFIVAIEFATDLPSLSLTGTGCGNTLREALANIEPDDASEVKLSELEPLFDRLDDDDIANGIKRLSIEAWR